MSDAFVWHMVGVDRAALVGMARSIILWDHTVVVVDGTEPDYEILVESHPTLILARSSAIYETKNAERQGLVVKSVYGCRNMGSGFTERLALAHTLHQLGHQRSALEVILKDVVFQIQRDGERLDE